MKNSNTKYDYDSQLKSSATSSFKLYFYIACFTFLSLRLLTALTGAVYANSTAGNGKVLSHSGVTTSIDPKNKSAIELLRAEISIAKSENDTKSSGQLKQIIEQIRSIEFGPHKQVPQPVIVPEKAPAIEPNETVTEVPVQKEQAQKAIESKPKYAPISEKTLQMLMTLAQDPMFYSEALRRKDPNDVSLSRDRAWILFQTGNCLRNEDLPGAAKAYQQLLTEYPSSPWSDLAKVRSNLIAWYLKDEPVKLIAEVKLAGSEQDNIR